MHTYEVSVPAGQYLYVVVDDSRARIITRLFGPDRKALLELDTIWRGKEHVTWIAETSGAYRLEVFPRRKEAPKERDHYEGVAGCDRTG